MNSPDVVQKGSEKLGVFRTETCIWLGRGRCELTNQDSADGKKFSVLTSCKQVRKGFKIRQLFPLEMALNVHEKGFTILKAIPVCEK